MTAGPTPPEPFAIVVQPTAAGAMSVSITGEVPGDAAEALRVALDPLLAVPDRLTVDLSATGFVSISALKTLIDFASRRRQDRLAVRFVNSDDLARLARAVAPLRAPLYGG